jgi:hypothetical protein
MASRLDLSEGVYYIMNQVACCLRDKLLCEETEKCAFGYLNEMGDGDEDTQNVLVVGVLEILGDTPESIARSMVHLKGSARLLFDRVLKGWESDKLH